MVGRATSGPDIVLAALQGGGMPSNQRDPIDHIHHLASAQHGAFTRRQARAAGISRGTLQSRTRRGLWLPVTDRVLIVSGSPSTDLQRVMIGLLDAGEDAVASNTTAAALWDVPGFDLSTVHVTVPRIGPRPDDSAATVHSSTRLPAHHLTTLHGIPVMKPTRLAFDLSGRLRYERWERVVELLWSRRLTSGPLLADMLTELEGRGRPRITVVRSFLDDRGRDYRPPDSGVELRFEQILRENGMRPMRRQIEVGDEERWLGCIDYCDDDRPFLLQIDSDLYHAALIDRRKDEAQNEALIAAGFVVRRITGTDVFHRVSHVLRTVRDGRREAAGRPFPRYVPSPDLPFNPRTWPGLAS